MLKVNKLIIVLLVIFLSSCTSQNNQNTQDNQTGSTSNTQTGITNTSEKTGDYNGVDKTGLGLKVANDFTISIFADNLSGARDLIGPDKLGNYLLSRTSEGIITMLVIKNGEVKEKNDILKNLNNPHGLALGLDGTTLYYAETDKLSKINLYSDGSPEKIIDLPKGGRHFTRSLLFGPDGKLYISIGSTCDVCNEKDERIASIYSINTDGSNFKKVASGLRNSVFMSTNPITGDIWATEMGRDNLGDNIPPDEINIIKSGNDYGWPTCYGNNVQDSQFDKNVYIVNPCTNKTPAHIELQAHSAPLGLSFIPEEGWPENYWNDLIISYHGSWNRSVKTGYKLVHITLDDKGNATNTNDFITGWLDENGNASGRPVDILSSPGGVSYITDDKKGVIYKLAYNNPEFILIDKQSFTDDENKIKADIEVNKNNEILINGEASGTWYFEAVFGIELVDENNNMLYQSYTTADSDWMTTDYVPFHSLFKYEDPKTDYGYIIFKKDNPSGLKENDLEKKVKIKIR
ncbi:MAG: PQQ-dependent sugar dehydrogenase [Candidatus Gracilibacteria bacterium]|nr:PQQ-dependent sugar dehydrogenase [Candidatus Gracilibacteria bacterium]